METLDSENPENEENMKEIERYEKLKSFAVQHESPPKEEEVSITEEEEERIQLVERDKTYKIKNYELILEFPFHIWWNCLLHSSILFHCAILLTITGLRCVSHRDTRQETLNFMMYLFGFDGFYLLDFSLAFCYRLCKRINTTRAFEIRPFWQLSLDILSLIPIETLYRYIWPAVKWRVFEYLYLNRLLRQYFLVKYIIKSRSTIEYQTVSFRLWEFFAMLFCSGHVLLSWLLGGTDCEFNTLEGCNDTWTYYYVEETMVIGGPKHIKLKNIYDWYWIALYVVVTKVTTNGLGGELEYKSVKECIFYVVTAILSFILRILIIITPLVLVVVFQRTPIFEYSHILKVLLNYLKEQKVEDTLVERVKDSYEKFWLESYGIKGLSLPNWLVPVTKHIICLDVYWNSYQHSHMFRDMDTSFLRHLSVFFTSEYYMPGDIIYKKHDLKSRMIYVVNGIIQVLSEEDDQTEIISFSTGTCIGESTIFLSYRTATVLKSATYTELYILERKTISLKMRNFPLHQKLLSKNIMEKTHSLFVEKNNKRLKFMYKSRRVEDAKRLVKISNTIRSQTESKVHIQTSLSWLKNSINALMAEAELENQLVKKRKKKVMKQENKLSLIDFSIYDEVQHKAEYLDLYNITQTMEYDAERSCLTAKFPWILKPESPFLIVWEKIILATILVMAIIIPHNATYRTSLEACAAILLMTIILVFDIYIQLTTALRSNEGCDISWLEYIPVTQDLLRYSIMFQVSGVNIIKLLGLIMNIRTIIYMRFINAAFIIDLVGSVPIELAVFFVSATGNELVLFSMLQMNRLIRVWKFESYFISLENSLHVEVRIIRLIKYSLYTCLITNLYACLLHWQSCPGPMDCHPYGWVIHWIHLGIVEDHKFGLPVFFSANIISGLGLNCVQPTNLNDIKFVMLGSVLSSMLFIYMVSGTVANNILSKLHWYKYEELLQRVERFMLIKKLSPQLKHRVQKFMNNEWQHSKSLNLLKGGLMVGMRVHLKNEIQIATCASLLKRVPLFQEVSNEFINKLATVAEIYMVPEQEIVTYAGSVNFELHIIQNGYSEVVSGLDRSLNRIIGPGSYFGEIEMCLQIPMTETVRTITNCKIIKISSLVFNMVLYAYPSLKEEFMILENEINAIKEKGRRKVAIQYVEFNQASMQSKKKSIYNFGTKLLRNSVAGQNYFRPFDKLKIFQCLRYLLLRTTFLPDGLFVKIWEFIRCLFAFLTCIFYPIKRVLHASDLTWLANFTYFFDITAYIDIYVRLHICYYTKDGILVYHPLETAKHYLKHAFLLDFLGCVPLEIFFADTTVREREIHGSITYLRLLQIHRIISGIIYKEYDTEFHQILQTLKYCPILIIVINIVAAILLKVVCEFDKSIGESAIFRGGINCTSLNWLVRSDYVQRATKKLTPLEAYLLGLYFSTSIITRTGLPGVFPGSYEDYIIITAFIIFGLLFSVAFLGAVAGAKSSKNLDLTYYQENMKTLVNFLKVRKIPKPITKDILNYFEVLWKSRQALDPHVILHSFHTSLKNDILYSLYGPPLTSHSIFAGTSISFFYNFLNFSHSEFYLDKSYIYEINDISTRFYVIIRGKAEVISAEGKRIAILPPGSLFGNLQNNKSSRQALSVMAKGNLDVLWIETEMFYQILTHYSQMMKKFSLITHRLVDFIPSLVALGELDADIEKDEFFNFSFSVTESESTLLYHKGILYPDLIYYRIWEIIAIVIGPFVTYILVIYQLCLKDYQLHLFIIGICFDIIYLARPFIQTRLAYENEVGEMVTRRTLIRKRYIFSVLGLAMDVITILPIEIFGFASSEHYPYYITLLRLNRLPRIFLLREFLETKKNKLNVNVFYLRIFSMIMHYLLIVHTLTCLHVAMACTEKRCTFSGIIFENKQHAYLLILQDVLQITTTSSFYSHVEQDIKLLMFYILVALVTVVTGAYVIGETYNTLVMATFSIGKYLESIKMMRTSCIKNNLSPSLVKRVWTHVVNLWNLQRGHHYPELLANGPACLRKQINTYLYENHLRQCHIFYHCDEDLLRQIALTMQETMYFPGNVIVLEGDIDHTMYFILNGEVQLLRQGDFLDIVVGILKAGETFGMGPGLLDREPHDYTYRARTTTVIVRLIREKWEYLLDFFPASRESIMAELSYIA